MTSGLTNVSRPSNFTFQSGLHRNWFQSFGTWETNSNRWGIHNFVSLAMIWYFGELVIQIRNYHRKDEVVQRVCRTWNGVEFATISYFLILCLQGLDDLLRCSRTDFVMIYKQASKHSCPCFAIVPCMKTRPLHSKSLVRLPNLIVIVVKGADRHQCERASQF